MSFPLSEQPAEYILGQKGLNIVVGECEHILFLGFFNSTGYQT